MKVDICYVLSFGFAARTVLHTDLVPELQSRGLSVAAICPGAEEESMQAIGCKLGVDLYEAPQVGGRLLNAYMPMRRYLFEDVQGNPALKAKHLRETEKEIPFKNKAKLLVGDWLNGVLMATGLQKKLTAEREMSLYHSAEVKRMLKEIQPKMLVATYPVSPLEAICLAEAQRLGIKTVVQLLSWDNITSKGRFPVLAYNYLSWGPIMTEELEQYYGVGKDRVSETGVAHFDEHVKSVDADLAREIIQEMGLDPEKPFILFGMSSPYFAPHEIDIVEEMARKVRANEFGEEVNFIVRPHPQNVKGNMSDSSWLPRLQALDEGSRVGVFWPKLLDSSMNWAVDESDLKGLVSVMHLCEFNINSGSTFAIDGLCHNKASILTLFDAGNELPWHRSARRGGDYIHIQKLVEGGGIYPVSSYEQLDAQVKALLANPDLDKDLRAGALARECGVADGKSSSRIAAALKSLHERI